MEERASQLWKQEKRFAHVDHLNNTQSIRFSITATWNRDKPHGYGPCRAFHYSRVRNMKITLITCHILPMEKCLEVKKINENQEIHWLINRVCFLSMEKQLMSTYSYIYVFWYVLMPRAPGVPRSCQMDGHAISTNIGSWFSRYTCKRRPDRVSGRTLRWFC